MVGQEKNIVGEDENRGMEEDFGGKTENRGAGSENRGGEDDFHLNTQGQRIYKGKRKMVESFTLEDDYEDWRSEFDDPSDADYIQPQCITNDDTDEDQGTKSDDSSLVVEDIEASRDKDTFVEKNPSKGQLMKKLKKMIKQRTKPKKSRTGAKRQSASSEQIDWYSDLGEKDDLHSLD